MFSVHLIISVNSCNFLYKYGVINVQGRSDTNHSILQNVVAFGFFDQPFHL